jgi:phosphodiesterase/alkaline phosphatase D-like protein
VIDLVKPAPRHLAAFFLLIAALLMVVALKPVAADAAAEQHTFAPELSQLGAEACGVATDSEGDLYVSYAEEYAVRVFDPQGEFLAEFEAFAEIGGIETVEPCGLAVDGSGAIYVSDLEGSVVKYAPEAFPPEEGTEYLPDETAGDEGVIVPEGGLAVAVNPADDHLYVAEFFFDTLESHIGEYEPDGTVVSQAIGSNVPGARYEGVAVRSDGRVYAVDSKAEDVYIFNAAGTAVETTINGTANPNFPSGFGFLRGSSLAVDQATGNVFVANQKENSVVSEFTDSGAFVSQIGPWVGSGPAKLESSPNGATVAVDNSSSSPNQGTIYVPALHFVPQSFSVGVYAFDSALTPVSALPVPANVNPASVTNESATLKATIDNEGAQSGSSCKFQLALASSPGTPVAEPTCTEAVGGEAPEAVQANATGLDPNTAYVYRVLATNAAGGPVAAVPDKDFSTLPNAPVVATDAEGALGQTTAVLNGHVDNEGAAAGSACSFEVALATNPTYSGSIAVLPCIVTPVMGSAGEAVAATATGLSPNTSYVYRVIATSTGGSVNGVSEPFSTLPNAPVVANDDPGTIAQTSIVLNGHVDNEGAAAGSSCKFVVAAAATPGTAIVEPACTTTPVNGTADEAVTATATGLDPNTAYVYRVVATNAGGTSTGAPDKAASTLPNAPVVANDDPGTITQTSVVLNGHVDNEGAAAGSNCKFVVATAAVPGTPVTEPPCTTTPVSGTAGEAVTATATGLDPNTAYVYRVVATSAGGTSTGAPDKTASTLPNAPEALTDPVGAVDRTTAVLNGRLDNEGASAGSTCAFELTRASDPAYSAKVMVPCTATPIAGTGEVAVTATATGLTADTSYIYRLRASSAGGSTAGTDVPFKTLPEPVLATPGAGGGTTPPGTAKLAPAATVSKGKALLTVSCAGPGSCRGTLKLTAKVGQGKKRKAVVIGTASYEIPAGGSQAVEVKLSAVAKKRLKKGRLQVKVSSGDVQGTVTLRHGA